MLYKRIRDEREKSKDSSGLNLLAFLTKEFISSGEQGQNILNDLRDWSEASDNDELSRKAAHSYGVVLWCHNADRLSTEAEEWASVESRPSWQRTAELLDGAYEIEQIKYSEKATGAKPYR